MSDKKAKTKIKHPILLVISLILMLGFIVVAYLGQLLMRDLAVEPLNKDELTLENAKTDLKIAGNVYAVPGMYGSTYKVDKKGDIDENAPMNYYYLIGVGNDYVLTVYTDDAELVEKLQNQLEATDRFISGATETIDGESFYIEGRLRPLTEDELEHLYTYVLKWQMFRAETVEDAQPHIIPYAVYSYNKYLGVPYVAVGVVGFIVCILLVMKFVKQRESVETKKADKEE